jgi:hypothetical protein
VNQHLNPTWEAKPIGITEGGTMIYRDKDKALFTMNSHNTEVFRDEFTGKPKADDKARLDTLNETVEQLRDTAEETGMTIQQIADIAADYTYEA